jgi:hypothetical protein
MLRTLEYLALSNRRADLVPFRLGGGNAREASGLMYVGKFQ